jgi:hypothetical protein
MIEDRGWPGAEGAEGGGPKSESGRWTRRRLEASATVPKGNYGGRDGGQEAEMGSEKGNLKACATGKLKFPPIITKTIDFGAGFS